MHVVLLAFTSNAFGVAPTFEGYTFFRGDLHVHSGASGDGGSADLGACDNEGAQCGALADLGALAREAELDFLALTDHANGNNAALSEQFSGAMAIALDHHDPESGLVVVPGAEVWYRNPGGPYGHKNLLLFGEDAEVAEFRLEHAQYDGASDVVDGCGTIWAAAREVEQAFGPTLLIPHHPAAIVPMVTNWSCLDPHFSPAVELYSEHGASDVVGATWDPPWSGSTAGTTVFEALRDHGHRLGFLGGTDRHDTHPGAVCATETMLKGPPYGGGLTVAVLPEGVPLSRSTLYDAIVARRTYATSGPVLPARVSVYAGGTLIAEMGSDALAPEGADLTVQVRVPADEAGAVVEVVLVGPTGDVYLEPVSGGVFEAVITSDEVPPWFWTEVRIDGGVWYASSCDDGGADDQERLWLSPIWLSPGPPLANVEPDLVIVPRVDGDTGEAPACGCRTGAPGAVWWVPVVGWMRRRRGAPRA